MAKAATADQRRERQVQVSKLMLFHMTREQIARAVGVSRRTITTDVRAIRKAWAAERDGAYEQYKAETIQVLNALQAAMWPAAMAGKGYAVDRCLAIEVQRGRVLGLEAPVRVHSELRVTTQTDLDREIETLLGGLEDGEKVIEVNAARHGVSHPESVPANPRALPHNRVQQGAIRERSESGCDQGKEGDSQVTDTAPPHA